MAGAGPVDSIHGGAGLGGDTVVAPAYGYESTNARHHKTYFPVDSEFYMMFLGPLSFIKEDGRATRVALERTSTKKRLPQDQAVKLKTD